MIHTLTIADVMASFDDLRDHSNITQSRRLGGWGRPNNYIIIDNLLSLSVMIGYKVGGWDSKDQNLDHVIFDWSLKKALDFCLWYFEMR